MASSRKWLLLVPTFVILAVSAIHTAKADDSSSSPVAINFDVEGPAGSVFNQNISVPACTTPNNATSTVNGFCAFAAAGLSVNATWASYGALINSISGVSGDSNNYWLWFINGQPAPVGIDSYMLNAGDSVLWALEREPLEVNISNFSPNVNASTTVTVLGFNAVNFDFEPVPSATLAGLPLITNSSGQAQIVPTSTDPIIFSVSANGFIPTQQFTITPIPPAHQVVLSSNSVNVGQPFTASAEQYDSLSATYTPLTNVTLGVVDSSLNEIATSTVDGNGQAVFTLNATGTVAVGIKEDSYFPTVPITITEATSTPPVASGGGGGGGGITHSNFNIPQALSFILAGQNADGSFGSPIITDWAAIAFAAENPGAAKSKLFNYLLNESPALSGVTDYERHAMALEAFGINPYSGTPINYIAAIANAFDGTQIGSPAEDNDDIFGLLVLEHAGYTSGDSIIQKEASFILSKQNPDGSWDETPDITAAAIQALGSLYDIAGVNAALGQAAGYLASTEQPDGSWGNVDSTSWVQTAINGIIQAQTPGFTTESAWASSAGYFPTDALAKAQEQDGGIQVPANRVWSTSYAVAAASGQSWVTILSSFPKPAASGTGGGSPIGEVLGTTTTSTLITITTPIPTTTPEAATSTIPVIITLPKLMRATPTTTSTAVVPKARIHKHLPKKVRASNLQAVLGASTTAPAAPVNTGLISVSSNRSGFFGNIWHTITSFFAGLF